MDGVGVLEGAEFGVGEVAGDEVDVFGDGGWGVVGMLDEGEGGPLGVFGPEL